MRNLNLAILLIFLFFVKLALAQSLPPGSENQDHQKTIFYPNPVRDYIMFYEQVPAGEMMLFDVLGREVMRFYYPGYGKVDLQHLGEGIYILKTSRKSGLLKKIK